MLERFSYSDIWLTYLIIGLFVAMVALKVINAYRFDSLIKLGWTNQYVKHMLKTPKKDFYFSSLLVLIACMCLALFYKIFFVNYLHQSNEFKFELVLQIFILIVIYLIVKYIAQKFIGFVFGIEKLINHYLIIKNSLLYYVGILCFIPILLMVYSNMNAVYLNISIVVLASFYLTRILFYFFKLRSLISNHLFYFILYICTFEIIPIFFLNMALEISVKAH